jgi:hypothetical protein
MFVLTNQMLNTTNHKPSIKEIRSQPATAKVGVRWSAEETAELLEQARAGVSLEEIAILHCRALGGVKSRLYNTVVSMVGTTLGKQKP